MEGMSILTINVIFFYYNFGSINVMSNTYTAMTVNAVQ